MLHQHGVFDADNRFTINPTTKVVTNQSEKTVLIQGDHNSERFTFELPRYIDGHDMSLCNKVEVHYLNVERRTKNTSKDVYPVTDLQIHPSNQGVVICSWLISGNATVYAGTLSFMVHFACVDENATVTYSWNTAVHEGIAVSTGISNSEAVVENYSDVLEQWKQELMEGAIDTSKYVTWDELLTVLDEAGVAQPVTTADGELLTNNDGAIYIL